MSHLFYFEDILYFFDNSFKKKKKKVYKLRNILKSKYSTEGLKVTNFRRNTVILF